ncbi:MAG: hypothetical protein H0W90_08125 [Actinobacteria bacterium]|nr:hypothetical protein [Actinomycetota bacterium]
MAGTNQRKVYRLTVPPDIAELVPEEQGFVVEMTDEGLLYRLVETSPERELPAWARPKS